MEIENIKTLNTRIQHKHDTEANWNEVTSFIPKIGELIIYDTDDTHNYERIKIGDGKTAVTALPFYDDNFVTDDELQSIIAAIDYPVDSVNGKTGAVVLNAADVGADASGSAAAAESAANEYTDEKIADLVNGAPETLDTLNELAAAMAENETVVEALNAAIVNKVSKTGDTMTGDLIIEKSFPSLALKNNNEDNTDERQAILNMGNDGYVALGNKRDDNNYTYLYMSNEGVDDANKLLQISRKVDGVEKNSKIYHEDNPAYSLKTTTYISRTTDLNALTAFGNYHCSSVTSGDEQLGHAPSGLNKRGFIIRVERITYSKDYCKQRLVTYNDGSEWWRVYRKVNDEFEWTDWVEVGQRLATVATSGSYTDLSNKPTGAGSSLGLVKSGGDVTITNGIITVNNADTVDGKHASNFAPSGFGLGTAAKDISNTKLVDTLKLGQSGWYRGYNVEGAPTQNWCYFEVISDGSSFSVVHAYPFAGGIYSNLYETDDDGVSGLVWGTWLSAGLIGTYTSLSQLGLTDEEMDPADLAGNLTKICNKVPRAFMFQPINSTNFSQSLRAKINEDIGLSLTTAVPRAWITRFGGDNLPGKIEVVIDNTNYPNIYTAQFDEYNNSVILRPFIITYNKSGFLPADGSKNITIDKSIPLINLIDTDTASNVRLFNSGDTFAIQNINTNGDTNTRRQISFYNSEAQSDVKNAIQFFDIVNGNNTPYKIYGEHNKPAPADIGAFPRYDGTLLTKDDDFDTKITDGVFVYSTDSVPQNAPFANASVVLCFGSDATVNQRVQLGMRYGVSGYMRFRGYTQSAWTDWTDVYTSVFKPNAADVGVSFTATKTSGTHIGTITLDGVETKIYCNSGDITGVTAGNGLTGGAASGAATLNVGAGDGISVTADAVALAASGVTEGTYGPSANVTGSNNTTMSVPEITVDTYGRITNITNRTYTAKNSTYTVNNKTVTLTAGKGLTDGGSFTANQSSDKTITFNVGAGTGIAVNDNDVALATYGTAATYGPSADAALSHSGTFTVPKITTDAYGRVTASNITYTLPASGNTDTQVTTTATSPSSEATWYLTGTTTSSTKTNDKLVKHTGLRASMLNGTTSTVGKAQITLGNSTASGTANNMIGNIALYSKSTSYHLISPADTTSAITHTLPAVTGTLINSGNLKNGTTKSSLASATTTTTSSRQYAVEYDSGGKLSVNVPWSNSSVKQGTSTTSSWRPLLSHTNYAEYGTNPGETTGQVYYVANIALQPSTGSIKASKVYGAVWNDYAEYRESDVIEPGRVICENGNDTLSLATERLQPGANVVSDTFGFAIGETETAKTPIAVSGRVLAYPYENRDTYKPGDAVCAAPGGTVSKMTREEIREYPERIVGTVSAIPSYEIWGEGNVPVNGRIWIKVR